MIPCLYDSAETEYTTNGIGKLADCISCVVTEKRNGSYELKMEYPSDGIHAESIAEGAIIYAKPADNKSPQAFRIYKITTPIDGKLEVSARHISYQLNFITVSPVSVVSGTENQPELAFEGLLANATTECPFTFETDITSTAYFGILEPMSFRSALGGVDGSMLDTYGGEFEWDMYTVRLLKHRGSDNGVRIVYGKNLIDFTMEKSIENMITGVHPFWTNSETGDVTELPEKVLTLAESDTPYEKISTLDCTDQFDAEPTEDALRAYAQEYLESTSYIEPEVDIDIDFEQLWQLPGYEDIAEAERVSLCDTVHVYISKLGIEVEASVTETEYDTLLERYQSITLSNSVTSSRNSSLALTVATTDQVKSLIAITDSAIRLSVHNSYVTNDTLEENYSTTTEVESMIDLSEEAITLAYGKILESYSTTEEINSLIQSSADGITLAYTKAIEESLTDYSTTTEVESLIQSSADGITLAYTTAIKKSSDSLTSSITSVSDDVNALSNKLTTNYSTTTETETLISEAQDSILLTVSSTYATTSDVTARTTHYGTCSTAAATAAKVVTCSGFSLYTGATVQVYFTYANTATTPTLNVNSTGAKSIYAYGATIASGSEYNWGAKSVVTFVYNGTYWYMADSASLSLLSSTKSTLQSSIQVNADNITSEVTRATTAETALSAADTKYGTCSTAASTAAKVVSCSSFTSSSLVAGVTICVYFTYANTAASPTLNVNSTGAKTIYAYGAAIASDSDYNWAAKSYVSFMYTGSVWVMIDAGASSKITQLANSISLSVTSSSSGGTASISLSVDGSTAGTGTVVQSARTAFAAESSSITISAGTITFSSGTLAITSNQFTLDSSGNATFSGTLSAASGSFSGTITATGGTIGGFTIGSSAIYSNGHSAYNTASTGVYIGTDYIAIGSSAPFKVSSSGVLTATSGTVGGFTLGSTSLSKASSVTSGTASTQYQIYLNSPSSISSSTVAMYVRSRSYDGDSTYGSWSNKFYVRYDGYVYAISGSVGGWTLSSTSLTKSSSVTSGTASTQYNVLIQAPSSPTTSNNAFLVRSRSYDGDSTYGSWSTIFGVTYGGYITAYGGGKIGAWTLESGSSGALYSGCSSSTSTTAGTYIGKTNFRQYASSSAYVNIASGVITAVGANISGTITATTLTASNITTTDTITVKNGSTTVGTMAYMQGATSSTTKTDGVGLAYTGGDYYVIATSSGVRLNATDSTSLYVIDGAAVITTTATTIDSTLTVTGRIYGNNGMCLDNGGTYYIYDSEGTARTAICLTSANQYNIATGGISNTIVIGQTSYTSSLSLNATAVSVNATMTVSGAVTLTRTTDASGTADNSPALRIGSTSGTHLELDGNEIMAKASGTTTSPLYLNSDGGLVQVGSGGFKTTGTLAVSGAATLSSTLAVSGAITASSTLTVSGTTTLSSTTYLQSNAYLSNTKCIGTYLSDATTTVQLVAMDSSNNTILGAASYPLYVRGTNIYIQSGTTSIITATSSAVTISKAATLSSTLTAKGNVTVGTTDDTVERDVYLRSSYGKMNVAISTAGNMGLYDSTQSTWIVRHDSSGNAYLTAVSGQNVTITGSTVAISGKATVSSTLTVTGTISSSSYVNGTSIYVGGSKVLYAGTSTSGEYCLGTSSQVIRLLGSTVTVNGSTVTSDERLKHDIVEMDDRYTDMLDVLSAKVFKYDEYRPDIANTGYTAQEVMTAMESVGLTDSEFGAVHDVYGDGSEYALDVGQFIPIMWEILRKQKSEIESLENKLAQLESQLA